MAKSEIVKSRPEGKSMSKNQDIVEFLFIHMYICLKFNLMKKNLLT